MKQLKLLSERVLHPDQSFRFLRIDVRSDKAIWHHHPQVELTWVERGSGIRFIGDNVSPFLNGDLVLVGSNVPHLWHLHPELLEDRHVAGTPPVFATVIQFPMQLVDEKQLPEMGAMQAVIAHAQRGLSIHGQCRDVIQEKLSRMPEMSPLGRLGALVNIFDELIRPDADLRVIANNSLMTAGSKDQNKRIELVLSWAQANVSGSLDAGAAAQIACISPSAFSRFFKRETGKTFTDYVIELRCSTACLKLLKSDAPISLIAEECGFPTLSNFNRIFLEYTKKTPSSYRKSMRKA
jgi:AraC-like DNA-binding protein/quercetin dioxygenase-like cupin family protein